MQIPNFFAAGAPPSHVYIAIGVPIDKYGIFFGKQGHPISATDHGIQLGGPMIDQLI